MQDHYSKNLLFLHSISKIFADKEILEKVYSPLKEKLLNNKFKIFGKLSKGLIATGDMFISEKIKIKQLSRDIDGLLAVEMEGAAFAQVAHQENLDWLVMRVISDGADENAHDDFNAFLNKYKLHSFELIKVFRKFIGLNNLYLYIFKIDKLFIYSCWNLYSLEN